MTTAAREIVVGTRGSALALAQTRIVCDALCKAEPDLTVRVERIATTGDVRSDAPLASLGRGIFVAEIEQALREGRIDVAVHSAKDMPSTLPDDLAIAAFLPRADARDVLVSRVGPLRTLPAGARVGTSSPRRICQLRALRPDLDLRTVRGNVDTRLRKLESGEFDALLLAAAGLLRLGRTDVITEWIDESTLIPCVGQGALALEVRATDEGLGAMLAALDHSPTRSAVLAERAFLARLGAGCLAPVAAHATCDASGRLAITAMIGALDGRQLTATRTSSMSDVEEMGSAVADELLSRGGDALLRFAGGPLVGKRIAVTRADRQSHEVVAMFRARGAEPEVFPLLNVQTVFTPELDAAIGRLSEVAWIAFTSANAVESLASRLRVLGVPLPPSIRLAAVGVATARAVDRLLRRPEYVGASGGAESLAASLPDVVGRVVLHPCGNLAGEALERGLRARGAAVDRVVVYETSAGPGVEELSRRCGRGEIDAVVFASPSSIVFGAAAVRSARGSPVIVCIGESTEAAARRLGVEVTAVAMTQSGAGLVETLERLFA